MREVVFATKDKLFPAFRRKGTKMQGPLIRLVQRPLREKRNIFFVGTNGNIGNTWKEESKHTFVVTVDSHLPNFIIPAR